MNTIKSLRSLGVAVLMFPAIMFGADKTIDATKSVITIHVGKAGMFSGAGHEHWVDAPIARGQLREGTEAMVEFAVDARALKVRPDDESEGDRAKVQETMQRDVLESGKYPQILFHSTQVTATSRRSWNVTGVLELHGVSKPVAAQVWRQGEVYTGSTHIRQKDFGIKPVSGGGGLVKVKDELDITFKVYAK